MRRSLCVFIASILLFVVGCRFPADKKPTVIPTVINEDLIIRRVAMFLFIMNNDGTWGAKEFAAEIEYVKYLLNPEKPDGR